MKYKGFRQAHQRKQTLSNLTAQLLNEEASLTRGLTVQEEQLNALATISMSNSSKNRKYIIKCYKCQ